MNKEILIKYLNNNCTDEEFEELAGWLENESATNVGKYWSYDYWKIFETDLKKRDEKEYSALLDKIHHEINLKHRKDADARVINFKKIAKWLSRAAAILFIPLLGVVFYLLSNNSQQMNDFSDLSFAVDSLEIIAPIGSRTVVQLSDGTEVNLNYGSKIKYPRNFIGDTREITLSGEAYFNVAHNPEKPFIVKTGELNVKALGTEFNVNAYPEDENIATTLVEGKVIIEKILPDNKIGRIETMVPNQHLTYNLKTGKISSNQVNVENYIAWKEGKLVFDNTSILDVTEKLGRMFNVEFHVADDVKDLTYTVTFADDPLFLILDLMTETTPITYKRIPRKKLDNGTLSKQVIIIERR
ncbi:MAG: FecR family protein [Fermentimonas sp.]